MTLSHLHLNFINHQNENFKYILVELLGSKVFLQTNENEENLLLLQKSLSKSEWIFVSVRKNSLRLRGLVERFDTTFGKHSA